MNGSLSQRGRSPTAAKTPYGPCVSRDQDAIGDSIGLESSDSVYHAPVLWTDDRSNLLEVLW